PQQNADQHDHYHLAPRRVEIHGSPFLDVIYRQFLPEREIEGVEDQVVAEGVDEERGHRGSKGGQQLPQLSWRPAHRIHPPPVPPHQPPRDDHAEHHHPDQPSPAPAHPPTEQQPDHPQRRPPPRPNPHQHQPHHAAPH